MDMKYREFCRINRKCLPLCRGKNESFFPEYNEMIPYSCSLVFKKDIFILVRRSTQNHLQLVFIQNDSLTEIWCWIWKNYEIAKRRQIIDLTREVTSGLLRHSFMNRRKKNAVFNFCLLPPKSKFLKIILIQTFYFGLWFLPFSSNSKSEIDTVSKNSILLSFLVIVLPLHSERDVNMKWLKDWKIRARKS